MTEQLTGHQIMDNKARLGVEIAEERAAVVPTANVALNEANAQLFDAQANLSQVQLQTNMDLHDETARQEDSADQAVIEARAISPEGVALNNEAQQAIWGDEYQQVVSVGYSDAEGNSLAVPAVAIPDGGTPAKGPSSEGKLAEIRTNPVYGKTQAERDQEAVEYEKDVLSLVNDEGFSLSQAKLIMDKRDAEHEHEAHLTGSFIADGLSPAEADEKARKVYDHKDEKRREKIKTEGILSAEDWAIVHAPTDDGPATGTPAVPTMGKEKDSTSEYKFPGQKDIYFTPTFEGDIQFAVEVTEEGKVLDLQQHKHTENPKKRTMLVEDTEGNQYLVQGEALYDVTDSRELKQLDRSTVGDLSPIEIGQQWQYKGDGEDGRTRAAVKSVIVATERLRADVNNLPEDMEHRGKNPLSELRGELGAIAKGARYEEGAATESPGIRGRVVDAMQRAHIGFDMMSRLQKAAVIGAVIGTIAIGGELYEASRGDGIVPQIIK